jgi:hypothetical protein
MLDNTFKYWVQTKILSPNQHKCLANEYTYPFSFRKSFIIQKILNFIYKTDEVVAGVIFVMPVV